MPYLGELPHIATCAPVAPPSPRRRVAAIKFPAHGQLCDTTGYCLLPGLPPTARGGEETNRVPVPP